MSWSLKDPKDLNSKKTLKSGLPGKERKWHKATRTKYLRNSKWTGLAKA